MTISLTCNTESATESIIVSGSVDDDARYDVFEYSRPLALVLSFRCRLNLPSGLPIPIRISSLVEDREYMLFEKAEETPS